MYPSTSDSSLPAKRRRFAIDVVERLRAAGHEALWAGGCVRDLLLERTPIDYDVATSARPEQVRSLFGHRRTLAVGAAFGVIIVVGPNTDAGQVEVATFRNDAQYSDGRRPDSVTFSTAQEDAERRDFTINGMFYDPLAQKLIDYVGGREDLERGLIRAIGNADARIGEDKLRMLRAVRFAARFNFAIEAATEAAIARHAADLKIVSGERMTAELEKTLLTSGRELAVRTWASTGLLQVLLPYFAPTWPDTAEVACSLVRVIQPTQWTSVLAALQWPWAANQPGQFRQTLEDFKTRLKFSNDDWGQVKFAVESQQTLARAASLRWSELQPCLIQPFIRQAVDLLEARVAIGEVKAEHLHRVQHYLAQPGERLNPAPLVDGAVLQSLGLQPGPRFKEILSAARAAQLDEVVTSPQEAVAWLQQSGLL